MARAPGEAGRDGANHVVTALLPKILDEIRTDPWVAALFGSATTLVVAALAHRRELIRLFLFFVLAVLVFRLAVLVFKVVKAARSARDDPSASPIDRAVSAAIRLQRQGNIEEAIEKWRAIANVVDGTDDELGARAWFSIGYLHGKESRHQKAVDAYNEGTRLKPDNARAYNNRGFAKRHLDRYEDAIADYDQAIRLKPDYAEAYNNRGFAKRHLGRYDRAIALENGRRPLRADSPPNRAK